MKVTFELIAEALVENEIESGTVAKVMKDVQRLAQIEAEEAKADREPPVKKQLVVIVSDPKGALPEGEEYVGWVAQISEDDDTATTVDRIVKSAYDYNLSKKGRRHPVKTIGEACEAVPARFQKEHGVSVKTKLAVRVLRTNNRLPAPEQ